MIWKKIFFWLSVVIAILIAIYFTTRIVMTAGDMGRTTSATIIAGDGPMNAREIAQIINLAELRLLNNDLILATIMSNPAVRDASVRRLPSGKIILRISTHEIVAAWTDGNIFYPLSMDGLRVGESRHSVPAGTIILTGAVPNDLSEIIENLHKTPAFLQFLSHAEFIENRRWNLYTHGGTQILLPENYMGAALARLMTRHTVDNLLNRNIAAIDMRGADRILVRTN